MRFSIWILIAGLICLAPVAIRAAAAGEEAQRGSCITIDRDQKCILPGSGEAFRDCHDCPEMVPVPAGTFVMGSPESERPNMPVRSFEGPQHGVTIAKPFAAGKFAVTFGDWDLCVAAGGCGGYRPAGRRSNWQPVINVSWHDAKSYAEWLSEKTGKSYRLLTEAEREYATRAGTQTPFYTGARLSRNQAQFSEGALGSAGGPAEVGSFPPNAFGLFDMHGNVWEWVEDCWHNAYDRAPTDGSAWLSACSETARVQRGGDWWINSTFILRSASRGRNPAYTRKSIFGFRLARNLVP